MRVRIAIFFCMLIAGFLYSIPADAQLNINFIAVNPSQRNSREIEVEYFLPKELEPDDILDTGPLKLDYNVDRNAMYVHGIMTFKPKESRTFKVRVKDVWTIDLAEVALLKDQLDKTLELLKDDKEYPSALYVRDEMVKEMDYILKRQEEFSGNIERRIEEYRANISSLEDIRDRVYNMDFLKYESKGIQEIDEMEGTVKMVVQVQNPSDTESLTVRHKHFLPKEIRGEEVIDSKGFEVRYDDKREKMYLTREEDFRPGEMKKYEIILKDVWNFPDVKVQDLSERMQIAVGELEGTAYQESAERLSGSINDRLQKIRSSKVLDTSVDRHIGLFRLNTRRYQQAWSDFKRIEEMISIVRAKKLQEYEKKKVKNVLERLKALRGLKQLSEALFKKRLSVNATWKIIFGTLGFLAFFTALHFFIWARRSKTMGEDLGPGPGEEIKVVPKPGEVESEEE